MIQQGRKLADLVLVESKSDGEELPCGCRLERSLGPRGPEVRFTFCAAHRLATPKVADPRWRGLADEAVRQIVEECDEFTTDEVWTRVNLTGVSGGDPRGMGAVMDAAMTAGLIARTAKTVKSTRPECHGRPVRVWRSLARSK